MPELLNLQDPAILNFIRGRNVLDLPSYLTMDYEKDNKLFYGMELEVNSNDRNTQSQYRAAIEVNKDLGQHANIRGEGSCNFGFEIVTVPATLAYHKQKLWGNFFNNSAKLVDGEGNVGIHIHFSREATTPKQLAKTFYFIHETTNSGFLSKIAGRRVYAGANWCTQRKKFYVDRPETEQRILQEEYGSRSAISVSGHYEGKSVECRIWKSNPTEAGVFQALEFMDAVLNYCSISPNTEGALSDTAFIQWFQDRQMKTHYPYLYENMVKLNLIEKGWRLLLRKRAA